MTEKEMERFLQMMDEHERQKQKARDKRVAKLTVYIVLFAFILSIIMLFLTR